MDVNTTSQQISGDQHTRWTSSEFVQNDITIERRVNLSAHIFGNILKCNVPFFLTDVTVCGRHSKLTSTHFVGEPVDLATRVAKDHGLRDVERVVPAHIARGEGQSNMLTSVAVSLGFFFLVL